MRWAFDAVLAVWMSRGWLRPLAHPFFEGNRIVCEATVDLRLFPRRRCDCPWGRGFLVCSPATNGLIRNGLFYAQFAEKLSRINVRLQTTNLGVGVRIFSGAPIVSTAYRKISPKPNRLR